MNFIVFQGSLQNDPLQKSMENFYLNVHLYVYLEGHSGGGGGGSLVRAWMEKIVNHRSQISTFYFPESQK